MNTLTLNRGNANFNRNVTIAATLLVAAVVVFAAGTDTTFGTPTTGPLGTITGWMTGSMGKLFALGCLAVGLGVGIVKQDIMAVAIGIGLALAASTGPAVLNGIFAVAM